MPSQIIKQLREVLKENHASYQEDRYKEHLCFFKKEQCLNVLKYIYKHHRKFYYTLDTGNKPYRDYHFNSVIHKYCWYEEEENDCDFYEISWLKEEWRNNTEIDARGGK